ncbi:MAG: hypothetical protein ACYC4L_01340 [Chloroflexota bacterium]
MDTLLPRTKEAIRLAARTLGHGLAASRYHLSRLNPCAYERVHDMGDAPALAAISVGQEHDEYLHDVDVYRSLMDVGNQIFGAREIDFRATGAKKTVVRLQKQFLERRRHTDKMANLYGWDSHNLRMFLERIGRTLHWHGVLHCRLHWGGNLERKQAEIEYIERLSGDDLRRVHTGSHRGTFRYINPHSFTRGSSPRAEYIPVGEVVVFRLEAPFTDEAGRSRLALTRPLVRRQRRLMTASVAAGYAWTHPEDQRCWVERARRLDASEIVDEQRRTGARIRGILGGMAILSPEPLTRYFDVWATLRWQWRLACFRESILRQFNERVVNEFRERNSLDPQGRLEVVGVESAAYWAGIITGLEGGRVSLDEAAQKLKAAQLRALGIDG